MQTADTNLATDWSRGRPRTLIAKDGAVWIWPGIPLAMKLDRAVQPLPPDWVQSWITALHGFEARYPQLEAALARASAYLTAGDEGRAQQALDLAAIDRFSPEGAALMRAVAVDLGISPLDMAVGTKSLPWGAGNQLAYLSLFGRFGGAAQAFEKGEIQINPDGREEHLVGGAGGMHRPMPGSAQRQAHRTRRSQGSATMAVRLWKIRRKYRRKNRHQRSYVTRLSKILPDGC